MALSAAHWSVDWVAASYGTGSALGFWSNTAGSSSTSHIEPAFSLVLRLPGYDFNTKLPAHHPPS